MRWVLIFGSGAVVGLCAVIAADLGWLSVPPVSTVALGAGFGVCADGTLNCTVGGAP